MAFGAGCQANRVTWLRRKILRTSIIRAFWLDPQPLNLNVQMLAPTESVQAQFHPNPKKNRDNGSRIDVMNRILRKLIHDQDLQLRKVSGWISRTIVSRNGEGGYIYWKGGQGHDERVVDGVLQTRFYTSISGPCSITGFPSIRGLGHLGVVSGFGASTRMSKARSLFTLALGSEIHPRPHLHRN